MTTGGFSWFALAARRRITDEKLQRIVRHVVPQVITSALAPPGEIFQQKSEIIGISVDFYGFLKTYRVRWVPLNFYGFLWISMGSYGFLWIPIDFYAFLWVPLNFYGFLWVPMDFYGFLWIPRDCSGFLRTSMDF